MTSNNLFVIYIFRGMIHANDSLLLLHTKAVGFLKSRDCVKFVGIMLMHYGQLKAYGEGSQPVVIEVNKPGPFDHFNTWHSKVTVSGQSITRIVAEAVFFKRVGFFFHLSW